MLANHRKVMFFMKTKQIMESEMWWWQAMTGLSTGSPF